MRDIKLLRCLATAILAFIGLLTAVPAHAHAELVAAIPAPGSEVSQPLSEIRLTFSEPIADKSQILLLNANLQMIAGVSTRFDAAHPLEMAATLPDLEPGIYTVQWTAVSSDGHETSGSYQFSLAVPFNGDTSRLPIWQWILMIAGSFLTVALILKLRRPFQRPSKGDDTYRGAPR
jgi:methionine-rich copper-binding protein CopC